jgi:hypothetical protein
VECRLSWEDNYVTHKGNLADSSVNALPHELESDLKGRLDDEDEKIPSTGRQKP